MSVIALPHIAPKGPGASIEWELRSNTARFPSPLTGYTRTLERFGSHWAATLRYENLNTSEAARMRAFLSSLRGQAQRFYLRDFGYTQRGSFAATELFTNGTFASGTTGWSATNGTLTAADGVLRLTPTTPAANVQVFQSVTLTQHVPYALRSILLDGRGTSVLAIGPALTDLGPSQNQQYDTARGLKTVVHVAQASGSASQHLAVYSSTSGFVAGDYVEIPSGSIARCALVDNGPNLLLRSNDGANAAWTKTESTSSANGTTAPDGSLTDQYIIETTNNAAHYISQTVAVAAGAADYALSFYVNGANRTWCWLQIIEGTGGTNTIAWFDLASGALGTVSASGNWSNARAFVQSFGNDWYRVTLVARKTNAATALTAYLGPSTGNGVTDYAGVASPTVAILWWNANLAQSSHPTRGVQTTTTADSDGTAQTGSALHLKALPVSTDGLLLVDDRAEIITPSGSQYVRARAALNSDAAGLGYFEFEPPLRESPVDNAGVILQSPMIRAMLDDRSVRWTQRHIGFTDLEFTAVEDITA